MSFPEIRLVRSTKGALILAAAVLAGCATTTPRYDQLFAGTPTLGNVQVYAASRHDARAAVLNVLAARNFQVKGEEGGIITAVEDYKAHAGSDKTYQVTARIEVQKIAPEKTQVSLAATQKTVVYQEWHTWWHLLWMIPIIPTGTKYKTTTTDSGAITSKAFYQNFFSNVAQQIKPEVAGKVAGNQAARTVVKSPASAPSPAGLKSASPSAGAKSSSAAKGSPS